MHGNTGLDLLGGWFRNPPLCQLGAVHYPAERGGSYGQGANNGAKEV